MDSAAVSRRNYTNMKGNKENAQPARGSKPLVKTDKMSAVPFQLKGNKTEESVAKNEPTKTKAKPVDPKKTVRELLSQRSVRGAAADVKRQTHSQSFLTEQAVKHKKLVAEALKPPASVVQSKSAPGMYKGKIVQSKIGSIWKSTDSVATADPKPSVCKLESQRVGNVARRNISKSVVEVPKSKMQKTVLARSRSVTDRLPQVSKPTASSHRPPVFCSARPPARTVPATSTNASSRNAAVAPIKASGNLNAKPKVAVAGNKIKKPPASSTLSQYRFNTETAEERREKLAEWLASKGKSLKRPAMTAVLPSKNKVSAKPDADVKPQSDPDPQPAAQHKLEWDPSPVVQKLDSPVPAHDGENKGAELKTHSQTPGIMNTTLDLLESSGSDLLDPQDRVDDIVVNLCDALEAMEPPSRCSDEELLQVTDECDVETDSSKSDECKELKHEELQDICQQPKSEQVEDEESVESDDETTPQISDASVIKYSVKTTPYLQSVKKTIEDEVSASASRRKNNIKDLKFLTPVRRSCRIQRKSSCLPMMLVDHDPCVSSLAELVMLDDDPNAYIYRKNPALLEDLPDQNL